MAEVKPRYHVLLIGIDGYPDAPLNGCVNDVEIFEQFLNTALAVPLDAITKLVAPHAGRPEAVLPTRERILAALRDLASESIVPGDRVLIYYAGHGTRRYFAQAETNYEAIVPVDYGDDPAQLIYDFELSPLLQAIVRRSEDVTVILDCCNSAGVTRGLDDDLGGGGSVRPRFLASRDDPDKAMPSPPAQAVRGLMPEARDLLARCSILAAAQADETAAEFDEVAEQEGAHGALSLALMQILRDKSREQLSELRWAALWAPLGLQLRQLGVAQRPDLIGSLGRRVFGGQAPAFEPGLPVRALGDGTFEIGAGELAGLGPGAEVALYQPLHPASFPPLGTAEDLAARIGLLVVTSADSRRALGTPAAGALLTLPEGARGRLACLGSLGRLQVSCRSGVADWLVQALCAHAAEDGTLIGSAAQGQGDTNPEVYIDQDREGAIYLGDAVYSTAPAASPGPLATIAVPAVGDEQERRVRMIDSLRAALRHYASYAVPLRLAQLAQRPGSALQPSSLDFTAVDARDPEVLAMMQQDAGRISELRRNDAGRYPIGSGDPICLRIHNLSWSPLFVTTVHCDSLGRVCLLSPPQQLAPSTGAFVWPSGIEVGVPFQFELSRGPLCIERIFAIATSSPDVDFRWLEQRRTLEEVISPSPDAPPAERDLTGPPAIDWTVARLQLEVSAV